MNYLQKTEYVNIPDSALKATVLAEVQWHHDQDTLTKGTYNRNGKFCAVGCLLKSGDHMEYEAAFGIPVALARLEDAIFEGLSNADSKTWPTRFMGACMAVGETRTERMAKLATVQWKFLHWLLTEHLEVKGEGNIFDDVRAAIAGSAAVIEPAMRGQPIDRAAACAAANAAYAAYAACAAAYATNATNAAANAACAAANAANAAVDAAYAANAAANAACAAADAADAACAAADAAYIKFADKLIELIEAA